MSSLIQRGDVIMGNKTKRPPNASLKALRAENGLSMADMAKILGISETSYLAKENNKRDWKSSEMFMLRKYFKRSMDEIFLEERCHK